jgi:hypothetical protein
MDVVALYGLCADGQPREHGSRLSHCATQNLLT